ncbi:hypothetical protein EV284_6409 [Streptomyces sp. BK022]|uniref:hypothetical protein n=1 Tax=Streptomyces sp. BK022 TaxID=2512123 RepID=UPI00102A759B|nr:hypothetical protein [Streptomyces sp. BK022]RZU28243.1 hypothetical protein EV284_6409 [Streptomyces sp. BK022]
MLKPAATEQLAELAGHLATAPSGSIATAIDAAEVRAETMRGRHTDEAFGRYCRSALPLILRRLLDAESQLAALRAQSARHVAAADLGDEPSPAELLDGYRRAGVDLAEEIEEARAELEAEAYAFALS